MGVPIAASEACVAFGDAGALPSLPTLRSTCWVLECRLKRLLLRRVLHRADGVGPWLASLWATSRRRPNVSTVTARTAHVALSHAGTRKRRSPPSSASPQCHPDSITELPVIVHSSAKGNATSRHDRLAHHRGPSRGFQMPSPSGSACGAVASWAFVV